MIRVDNLITKRHVKTVASRMSRMIGQKRKRQYSASVIEEAVDMVKSKAMSLNRAAREFDIPKTTLFDKVITLQ